MWIEKLSSGVLRMQTPLGSRYIQPTFPQRLYLLWMFRNFKVLPFQVLNVRQRKLVDRLCAEQRFISIEQISLFDGVPILGTLEQRPAVETGIEAQRRPNASVRDSVASWVADVGQRS
jgi:hypothetical protein